jgi:DNA-binding MarR family transcriptional regulator
LSDHKREKAADRTGCRLPPPPVLLTWTTIAVNDQYPGSAGRPAESRGQDGKMSGSKNPRRRTVALRNPAAARRGPRPAIALDVLDFHLGYFVRRLQVWIFQDFIRTLRRIDVSPAQFSTLVVVNANSGLSQAELGATLGIERARLARLLHRLQDRGLVERLPSDADGRRHALRLTPRGRVLLTKAKTLASLHEKRLMEKLGPDRHGLLINSLRNF